MTSSAFHPPSVSSLSSSSLSSSSSEAVSPSILSSSTSLMALPLPLPPCSTLVLSGSWSSSEFEGEGELPGERSCSGWMEGWAVEVVETGLAVLRVILVGAIGRRWCQPWLR